MIKKQTIFYILSLLIITISIFSYGYHVYDYYKYSQIVITGLILLSTILFLKIDEDILKKINKVFSSHAYIVIMFLLMIVNTITGHMLYQFNSITSIINTILIVICAIFEFYILPAICTKYNNIENDLLKWLINLCFIFSIISILIELNGGSFLIYKFVHIRNSSIFYDPNFAAMILGTTFILLLKYEYIGKFKKIIMLITIGIAVFLTGSRGTLLSIILTIFLYILVFKKIKFSKKLLLTILFMVAMIFTLKYLYTIDYFRVYQGSNNRIEMWLYTLKFVQLHPIFGAGYQSITNFLYFGGFTNASTHNSFIDYVFAYGIPCFILYILLIVSILINALKTNNKENEKYILATLFALINANTILYSFGGVGISSLLFTFFLGLLNFKQKSSEVDEKT